MVATPHVEDRIRVNDRELPLLPKQAAFLDLDCRYPGYIGGLGSGKSHVLLRRAHMACAMNPGLTGIYACLTYPLLKKAILPEFRLVMSGYGLVEGADWTMNRTDMVVYFWCYCDAQGEPAKIYFMAVEGPGNLTKLIGINAAWACLDEAGSMIEDAHRRVSERVRDKRSSTPFIAVGTTPEGLNWLYDRYVVEPRERAASASAEGGSARGEDWRFVRGRTADNPHVDDAYVESLRARYPEHLIEAYLEGYFVPMLEGMCFQFSEHEHVTTEARYDPLRAIKLAWDFNVNPMSVSVSHWDGVKLQTFDEFELSTSRTEDVCIEFLGRYGGHQNGVHIHGDAGGFSRSTKARWTDYQIIKQHLGHMPGFREFATRRNPSQRDSINAVNALLRNGYGEVNYAVHPRCIGVIRSFLATKYDDKGQIFKKGNEGDEHFTDGIRYKVWDIAPLERSIAHGSEPKQRITRGRRILHSNHSTGVGIG